MKYFFVFKYSPLLFSPYPKIAAAMPLYFGTYDRKCTLFLINKVLFSYFHMYFPCVLSQEGNEQMYVSVYWPLLGIIYDCMNHYFVAECLVLLRKIK